MRCRMRIQALLLLLAGICHPDVLGASVEQHRRSLESVAEFDVLVEALPDELATAGLSEQQIQTDVELRLRLANVVVAPSARSYLYVRVNGLRLRESTSYSVSIEFLQPAMLLSLAQKE